MAERASIASPIGSATGAGAFKKMKHEWIDVEDQLPKSGETVLCLVKFFDIAWRNDLIETPMKFIAKRGWEPLIPQHPCLVCYWRPRDVLPEE